jgi:hypothetical protein
MLNARTIKEWIVSSLGLVLVPERSFFTHHLNLLWLSYNIRWFRPQAVSKHMIAVSTNLKVLLDLFFHPNFTESSLWSPSYLDLCLDIWNTSYVPYLSNLLEYFKWRFWCDQFPSVHFFCL